MNNREETRKLTLILERELPIASEVLDIFRLKKRNPSRRISDCDYYDNILPENMYEIGAALENIVGLVKASPFFTTEKEEKVAEEQFGMSNLALNFNYNGKEYSAMLAEGDGGVIFFREYTHPIRPDEKLR